MENYYSYLTLFCLSIEVHGVYLGTSRNHHTATVTMLTGFPGLVRSTRRGFCVKFAHLSTTTTEERVTKKLLGNGVVHVMLTREAKMNALDMPMFEALQKTALELAQDKSVRAVILSGNGKAFCSGLDVKSMSSSPMAFTEKLLKKPAGTEITNLAQDVGYLWRMLPAPVIAVTHGICFGGGLQIALGCDFRISTPDCKFSIMERYVISRLTSDFDF